MNSSDPGFEIVQGVLQPEECAAIARSLGSGDRSRAGHRHLMSQESVCRLAHDPRLLSLAANAIGEQAAPLRATLFDKSPSSNWLVAWHQDLALPVCSRVDAPGWGPWSMKGGQLHALAPARVLEHIIALRVQLDDSTADNGPLRVLPHTHVLGRLSDERIRQLSGEIVPVDCTVGSGGVIAMRPLLLHASSKLKEPLLPRRVIHVEYARGVDVESGIRLALA